MNYILACLLLTPAACSIGYDDTVVLNVPYHAQEEFNYCVPAAVQMWADYDGASPLPSQTEIWQYVGMSPCDAYDAADGVNHFTLSGYDAYVDLITAPSESQRDQMLARQITSIDYGVPVIAVIYPSRNHVGVLNGGTYSPVGGSWRWDTIRLHNPDPSFGPNFLYSASDWLTEFCDVGVGSCIQIISAGASYSWAPNLSQYGDQVFVYGSVQEEYQ